MTTTPRAARPPKASRRTQADPAPAAGADAAEAEVEVEEESGDDVTAEVDAAEPSESELKEAEPEGEDAPLVPAKALARIPDVGGTRTTLQRYMQEIGRHSLLTREEEHDLGVKLVTTGDVAAAARLVSANLRLVVKIAFEYQRTAFNLLDLIQEGNIGLMHAVKKFDPYKGVKLSTYAAWWIRAYILRYVMENWRLVKLGTTQAQRKLFFNLKKEKEKLLAQGFDAGPKMLAERLDVTEQEVVDMDRRLSQDEFSLDAPVSDDSSQSHQDRLSSGAANIEDTLGEKELAERFRTELSAFGKTLTDEKERFIFEKRLTSNDPLKLQEIGDRYGVSRERARQIEAKLTQRLKEYLKARLPDFAELSFDKDD